MVKCDALWREGSEHARVLYVIGRVVDVLGEGLRRRSKRAAEHRFVNKVDSELERVASRDVAQVIAKLVFVLIAQGREKSDGSGELVVAESFES